MGIIRFFPAFLLLLAALFAASCGPVNGSSSSASSSPSAISDLASIPDFRVDAPDSLGGQDMKMKMKVSGRLNTVGDTGYFNPGTLPDVRSGGWKMMYDILNSQNGMEDLLYTLRDYASNHSVYYSNAVSLAFQRPGDTNAIPVKFIAYQLSNGMSEIFLAQRERLMDGGVSGGWFDRNDYVHMLIQKNPDGKYFARMDVRFEPLLTGNDTNSFAYKRDASTVISEMQNKSTGDAVDFVLNCYAMHLNKSHIDGVTGEIIIFSLQSGSPSNTVRTVAIGNSTNGGLINRVSDGPNDFIYTEYYIGNGVFVHNAFGSVNPDMFSWMNGMVSNGVNLLALGYNSAPASIPMLEWGWGQIPGTNLFTNMASITNAGGAPVVFAVTNGKLDIYFKSVGGPLWQPNDCSYVRSNTIMAGLTNTNILVKGMLVPAPKQYLGTNFYMTYEWPLKYLAPADPLLPAVITRRVIAEQTIVSTNTNTFLNQVLVFTNLFQDFDWWLDKNNTTNFEPQFDIMTRNVGWESFFYFDPSTKMPFQQRTFVVRNSDPFPQYFKFMDAGRQVVGALSNRLISTYSNEMIQFNFSNFYTNLPPFPDKSAFPSLP